MPDNHPTRAPNCPSLFYMAICSALIVPTVANAQDSGVSQLAPVKVQGAGPTFQPDAVQSTKFQAPLLDTPQTINIVPSEVLKQQSAQSLQDVLSNVPGITFSSGEGGAGWGDMFTIRGFSAEQSVTVDGVRDSALTSRNDIFNMEQAEVFKGTGSIESGVASIGGSVNMVSKTPKLDNFYDFTVGLGTDRYRRTTADLNHQIGATSAFRLNAMVHENDVSGRGPTDFKRFGIAPSFSWGLGTPTRVTASYFYQKDNNTPDFGVPINRDGHRMKYIGKDYWGGLSNADVEKTETNSAMLRVEHDFNEKFSIRNQTKWSETKRFTYLTSGGRLLDVPAGSSAGAIVTTPTNDFWGYDGQGNEVYPSGYLAAPRLNNVNSYKGTVVANQTDLNFDFNTGSVRHQMVTGLEVYEESYRKDPYSHNVPDFNGKRVIDVRSPDTHYAGPWKTHTETDESGAKITNWGLYAYDQITLNKNWEIAAGLRYDRFRVKWYEKDGSQGAKQQKDGVWSGRLGVVYKPVEYGSIYASYSQATQPSVAAAASRSGSNANQADNKPGKATTLELGTKWDLLDEKVSLTGAVFQITRSNPTDTDELGVTTQSTAKERVRGFELGLAGQITPQWSAHGGFTMMDSEVLEFAEDPLQEGGKMKNVPNMTFNLWTNYAINPQWDAGVGAQYVGKRRFYAGNTTDGERTGKIRYSADVYTPAYWLFNAAVGYKVNKNLSLRLNVNNIFDQFYLARATSSSDGFQLYGVPGAGRTVILNAEARF